MRYLDKYESFGITFIESNEFKSWFGDWENESVESSKIVDGSGKPLVCYHASSKKIKTFDVEYQKIGWMGKGFYFSVDKNAVKEYGSVIHKVYLNIRNPFVVEGESPSDVITEIKKMNKGELFESDVSKVLKKYSYDGVIFNHWDKGNMISCFYPEQIKLI